MKRADRVEPTDEKELVRRLKAGQEWAYRQLVLDYETRLHALAFGITLDREESFEIVQDVFVSVYRNIGEFREEASLSSWLHRITVNLCLNWKRKWKRRFRWKHGPIETEGGTLMAESENAGRTPEAEYAAKEYERRIMKGIGELPEKIRTVFVLSTFEDLSYEEISKIVGVKRGTVSSRVHTARKHLREMTGDGD